MFRLPHASSFGVLLLLSIWVLPSHAPAASFEEIKAQILVPKCIMCHRGFAAESSVLSTVVPGNPDGSILYQLLSSGAMPMGKPRLTNPELKLVTDYIAELNVEANPLPELKPAWTSLKLNLIGKYCLQCHNHASGFERPTLNFESSRNVKAEANQILNLIQLGSMPPPQANLPAPDAATVSAFEQWIQTGFPN